MPSGIECECAYCRNWRAENLPYGTIHHSNLTPQVVDALAKQNAPKGANAKKRLNRPKMTRKRHR